LPVTVRFIGQPIGPRLRQLPAVIAALRTKYLTLWAGQIVISERMNIDEGRAPDGSMHPALKHPRGKGHNQGNHPLKDSGEMYDSIKFYPLDPTTFVRIGPTAVSKKGFPYPVVQNDGYPKGESSITARIPRRRFVGLRSSDRTFISEGALAMAREAMEILARE
jgi:hypothetical protein